MSGPRGVSVSARTARRRELAAESLQQSPWKPAHERARQRELKREAVVLAAARAFRALGLHNTTLDDIASFLNVTKPTIYYYLSNKEQIIFECFRQGTAPITALLAELEGSAAAGREKLKALVLRYAETMASDFGWCMVRVEDHDVSPAVGKRIRALKSEIDHGIRALIRAGIADGSICECDPKMTAFALAGALNGIGHWYRADEALQPHEIADQFSGQFFAGLAPRP
jgi:AcrR family transcriptional regulator